MSRLEELRMEQMQILADGLAKVRADEREACAKIADKNGHYGTAAEIRARSSK